MNDILMEVLTCVVTVSAIIITRYVVPYLSLKIKASKYSELLGYIEDAVRWAKQTLTDNEEKKQKVLEKVVVYVASKGIDVTYEDMEMLIEAIYEVVKKEG